MQQKQTSTQAGGGRHVSTALLTPPFLPSSPDLLDLDALLLLQRLLHLLHLTHTSIHPRNQHHDAGKQGCMHGHSERWRADRHANKQTLQTTFENREGSGGPVLQSGCDPSFHFREGGGRNGFEQGA